MRPHRTRPRRGRQLAVAGDPRSNSRLAPSSERLPKAEVDRAVAYTGRRVDDEVSEIDPYWPDWRIEAQTRSKRLGHPAEAEVRELPEDIARVGEDRPAEAPEDREAQLVVRDEERTAAH